MNDPARPPADEPTTAPHDQAIDVVDLAVLGGVARVWAAVDPPPSTLVPTIQFGIALDAMMAEVATIQREGAGHSLAGVRSGSGVETESPGMTFDTSDVSMTVTTSRRGPGRLRIDGWITPDHGGAVGLRLATETRRHDPQGGRFWFDDVPSGHVQLFVEDADGTVRMVTPAVQL